MEEEGATSAGGRGILPASAPTRRAAVAAVAAEHALSVARRVTCRGNAPAAVAEAVAAEHVLSVARRVTCRGNAPAAVAAAAAAEHVLNVARRVTCRGNAPAAVAAEAAAEHVLNVARRVTCRGNVPSLSLQGGVQEALEVAAAVEDSAASREVEGEGENVINAEKVDTSPASARARKVAAGEEEVGESVSSAKKKAILPRNVQMPRQQEMEQVWTISFSRAISVVK